jgi:hypothetical protein
VNTGLGSTLFGAFVGFVVILALAWLFPGIGHILGGLIGGFVAGLVAHSMIKGPIAGFLAAISAGIVLAVLAFLGAVYVNGVNFEIFGVFFGGLSGLGTSIVTLILGGIEGILAAIGGFIGGLLTRK